MLCVVVIRYLCNIIFSSRNVMNNIPPIYFPRTTLALPPSGNSDPGLHNGPSSSLPTSARAFIIIARRQHFLPSSTRVELYQPTLLGALSSWSPLFFFAFLQMKSNLIMVGIELKDKQTLAVLEGKTTRPPGRGRPADN